MFNKLTFYLFDNGLKTVGASTMSLKRYNASFQKSGKLLKLFINLQEPPQNVSRFPKQVEFHFYLYRKVEFVTLYNIRIRDTSRFNHFSVSFYDRFSRILVSKCFVTTQILFVPITVSMSSCNSL